MVPPSLRDKWPDDLDLFCQECLPQSARQKFSAASASTGVEFLRLLDDPPGRRRSIIFLTHGAFHRGLGRGHAGAWVKLALIQRALHRRKNLHGLRKNLCRRLGEILEVQWVDRYWPGLWEKLLSLPVADWKDVLREHGVDLTSDGRPDTDDDPVPAALARALKRFGAERLAAIVDELQEIPRRDSSSYDERMAQARADLNGALHELWVECLHHLRLRLPLLILDEAHHLKNEETRLASLFQVAEAENDAEEITNGPLGGVFERMLFLTATPFQLGHGELCSVLDRFKGIAWIGRNTPRMSRDRFSEAIQTLRQTLDAAQESAQGFDQAWGKLRHEDLCVDGLLQPSVEAWWQNAVSGEKLSSVSYAVVERYRTASAKLSEANAVLRPWVIRHLRSRTLDGPGKTTPRRRRLPGRSILDGAENPGELGLHLPAESQLPFLLAARAAMTSLESRPIFAEGLASSYEAFLQTRRGKSGLDTDADPESAASTNQASHWYLDALESTIRLQHQRSPVAHPKIQATAQRVLEAWRQGEKVVVFCHFIQTGRALRRTISALLHEEILQSGARKLRCSPKKTAVLIKRLGKRFFDTDSPVRKACNEEIDALLKRYPNIKHRTLLQETIRRYVRTPSFLVRYFPLSRNQLTPNAVHKAFRGQTGNGDGLMAVLESFLEFLQERCTEQQAQKYIESVSRIQTGEMTGREAESSFDADELGEMEQRELLLPNVRLINGGTSSETRRRLMLTFNSPFFPEILVTSNVMAEGVDLHRFCRIVIHHDLDWNPSTLEQRTGRLDRIGAKVERCRESIDVFLPYVSATQDEKMFRVVMDRERWFGVVMGEKFSVDARSTEELANRVPLPESIATEMALCLNV
jgi:hypothetical protein